MKTKLKKHIRNCIPFVLTLFFIPVFTVNSSALTFDGHNIIDVLDGATFYNVEPVDVNTINPEFPQDFFVSSNAFSFYGEPYKNPTTVRIGNIVIPKESRVIITVTSLLEETYTSYEPPNKYLKTGPDDCLSQIQLYLGTTNGYTTLRGYSRGNSAFSYGGCRNTVYFTHSSSNEITNMDVVLYTDKLINLDDTYTKVKPVYILNVFALPNNATDETLSTYLALINTKLQQIVEGSVDSNNAVENFNSVFDDFNSGISNLNSFDDSILGEFNSANSSYKTQLNNFTLSSSLLNAGNFLSTSMQTVYDSSSDYKMLWLVPLLFGIPILLFVIRKIGDDK